MSLGKSNIKSANKKNIAVSITNLHNSVQLTFIFILTRFRASRPRLMQKTCAHQTQVGSMLMVSPGYIV